MPRPHQHCPDHRAQDPCDGTVFGNRTFRPARTGKPVTPTAIPFTSGHSPAIALTIAITIPTDTPMNTR
jgi:hypothetical protein